uniref:MADF domain-containing protein n=1 Tax=Myripristis murdjan TaxID=586833 RepID=A0A667XSL7_9TELE
MAVWVRVTVYPHLYDLSSRHYKDIQMANNSWREIAENTGLQSAEESAKKWKNLRDKYVRLRRKMVSASGSAGGKTVPALVVFLSWLAPHIKHRETSSNYEAQVNKCILWCVCLPKKNAFYCLMLRRQMLRLYLYCLCFDSKHGHQPIICFLFSTALDCRPTVPPAIAVAVVCAHTRGSVALLLMEVQKALESTDEYSRFGQTIADMLRRIDDDRTGATMFEVYNLMYEHTQRYPKK